MKPIQTGIYNDAYFKRQAKKLKKELGIPHHEALDKAVQAVSYSNWRHYKNGGDQTLHPAPSRSIPHPSVLSFRTMFSRDTWRRPNAKMPIAAHQEVGSLLQEVVAAAFYRKSVKNPVGLVRSELDEWLQHEYTREELPYDVFSEIYYRGDEPIPDRTVSDEKKEHLVNSLCRVQQVLSEHYHVCGPLKAIHKRLDSAINAIERWPVAMQAAPKATRMSTPIKPGTLVWLKPLRRYGRVYKHDLWRGVHCYSEQGFGVYGREEVSVPVDQSSTDFLLPMRLYLPYGKWVCADGSEVLFNRDYCPIWAKTPAGNVFTLDPDTWVSGAQNSAHVYYYDPDAKIPWQDKAVYEKCMNVLKQWGVHHRRPRVLDVFDDIIKTGGDVEKLQKKSMTKLFPAEQAA